MPSGTDYCAEVRGSCVTFFVDGEAVMTRAYSEEKQAQKEAAWWQKKASRAG